ncbi:bifunctional DedA family/phosphatase PAP2 family protein [Halomonas sp. TRM85114]|uniref:bifunctional DedA family/phosphatase PAP2 family protein n=1 Tax=Halomonas jincaotanensis TaxID=2810616 RepID=UPI001BD2D069|nr:bifunctional DedA family/phosphatase PAP2 family protein [Halomonas jincaotanensis]MBS9403992.1 bifunctional DedA family/phosphatase PAP2 family protein [Halomonas jincaotanensis]
MNILDSFYQLAPSPGLLLLIIGTIALVESLALIGLLVPGVVLITASASLAGHQELAPVTVILVAFIGAILGDGLSFWLGYTQRENVNRLWPLSRYPEWIAHGERFFQRYGTFSVFLGRFVGPVRPVIPMIAGMLQMSPRTFTLANLLSALLWAPAYVLPGYLLGRTWQERLDMPEAMEHWLIGLGVMIVILAVIFSWLRHQTHRSGLVYRGLNWLARQHPQGRRLWRLLSAPHDRDPPLASWLLLLFSLMALSAWTLVIIHHQGPLAMDQRLHDLLASLAFPWMEGLGQGLAKVGDWLGIVMLALPWGVWLLWRRQLAALGHVLGGLIGIAVLNTLGKAVIGRERPHAPDYLADSLAYPSAHTSTAVVLFGMAAAFIARELSPGHRFWAYWGAIAIIVPMALSRLMIGVHWLSDLIGGALLGLVVCALVQLAWLRRPRHSLAPCPWPLLVVASLALVSARVAWLAPV